MQAAPEDVRMAPPAMPQPVAIEPEPARSAAAAPVVIAAPSRLQATHLPMPDPRAAGNPPSPADARAVQPDAERSRPPALAPTRPADANAALAGPPQPIASVRPAPGAAAPLRPQALQQAQRTAKPDAAPVVQVTIDRIDVRMPAPSGAPAPGRKARPASAVAPLADYLRGKTHNGAAR